MQLLPSFMPQNWQENNFRHNLKHSFRQMWRSRKRFLSFLFVVTFAITIFLHSLIPAFLVNDQAIAQIKSQIPQLNQPIIPPSPPINQPVDKRQEIRGVWLTSNDFSVIRDRQQLSKALKQLKQLNFNTIYPVVWNSGYVMYPSTVAQEAGIQPFVYRGLEGQDIVEDISSGASK
jgi:uncharacterized lipoprotein YddW (UPF0748 family)